MSIRRIPAQAARDRAVLADFLRDTAAKLDRAECDPYGVVLVLVGPERTDVAARGIRYRHDLRRARLALLNVPSAHPDEPPKESR